MSTQSIKELNSERYLEHFDKELLKMSDMYFYKKKFLLGNGIDRDRMIHAMLSVNYLCSDTCEMTEFIKNKILGKLNVTKKEKSRLQTLKEIIEKYKQDNNCSEQQALNECCGWESVAW